MNFNMYNETNETILFLNAKNINSMFDKILHLLKTNTNIHAHDLCGGKGKSLKSWLLPPTTFMEYLLYLKANYEEMLKQRGEKSVHFHILCRLFYLLRSFMMKE